MWARRPSGSGRESLIAAWETDELAAFARLRTRMLEAETRPEIAAALFALQWEDLLPALLARLGEAASETGARER